MSKLIIRHKVQDYSVWRPGYDGHAAARTAAGCLSAQVFQSANDSNEITVIMDWPSVETAQAFASSPDLKEVMKNLGVISQPDVSFLVEA